MKTPMMAVSILIAGACWAQAPAASKPQAPAAPGTPAVEAPARRPRLNAADLARFREMRARRGDRLPGATGRFAPKPFGKAPDGKDAHLFRLTNANGMVMDFTDFGARVVRLYVPDRHGNLADVTIGELSAEAYEKNGFSMNCTLGRFGNRIANGKFSLDGKDYSLPTNNAPGGIPCCLHGGPKGWDHKIWSVRPMRLPGRTGLQFTYASPDGEAGFPGNVIAKVTHWLTQDNRWIAEYEVTSDKKTVLNTTNHAYFNLAGVCSGKDVLGQELRIAADKYLEVTPGLIPRKVADVKGTPFDFTEFKKVGAALPEAEKNEQLRCGNGWYDHNFVLRGQTGALALAAEMRDPESGRTLEIWTTEPGMQFYGGQGLSDKVESKIPGKGYRKYAALALETQHYPDSPNQPEFPSTVLEPGKPYKSTTEYRFGVMK